MQHNKKKPSINYIKNIEYYKQMHKKGINMSNGAKKHSKDSYNGKTTSLYANIIKNIIEQNNYRTLLEYGCGKAFYYENQFILKNKKINSLKDYWGIEVRLYDPCYEKFSKLTTKKSDITICIDVLEHIPREDINWVLEEFFKLTKSMVFMNIACVPAGALLPNGENAHINIQTPKYWHEKLVRMKKLYNKIKIISCYSLGILEGKQKFMFSNIDDHIKKYL